MALKKEKDGMSEGEGDGIDGEEERAPPDLRVRAGPTNKPTQKESDEMKQRTYRSETGAHTA